MPGEAVPVADIGIAATDVPGKSLVCVTSTHEENMGEWHFPNGSMVPHNGAGNISRTNFSGQVQLNRRKNATIPTGLYECRVPDGNGTLQIASIAILTGMTIIMCLYKQDLF